MVTIYIYSNELYFYWGWGICDWVERGQNTGTKLSTALRNCGGNCTCHSGNNFNPTWPNHQGLWSYELQKEVRKVMDLAPNVAQANFISTASGLIRKPIDGWTSFSAHHSTLWSCLEPDHILKVGMASPLGQVLFFSRTWVSFTVPRCFYLLQFQDVIFQTLGPPWVLED